MWNFKSLKWGEKTSSLSHTFLRTPNILISSRKKNFGPHNHSRDFLWRHKSHDMVFSWSNPHKLESAIISSKIIIFGSNLDSKCNLIWKIHLLDFIHFPNFSRISRSSRKWWFFRDFEANFPIGRLSTRLETGCYW